jgi:hypothetical protein
VKNQSKFLRRTNRPPAREVPAICLNQWLKLFALPKTTTAFSQTPSLLSG